MKEIIDLKKAKETKGKRTFSRKKLIFLIAIIVLVFIVAICSIIYASNKEFRNFMDQYLFHKNISEENVPTIEIADATNSNVIAYGRYLCILADNKLSQYNGSGNKEQEVKIEIHNPIYETNGRYLVIGEKNSQKLYLLSGMNIAWEKEMEGNIAKVTVNQNGYVSCIVTGTTYKSVIITYDAKGNELFKTYRSSTIAVDVSISKDNQYLAFAEINTSGTVIQSNIKVISVQKSKEDAEEPIVYNYTAPQNSLILRIKYQDKNRLVCMYDDSIHMIESDVDMVLLLLNETEQKITFADINLNNYVFRSVEKSTGLFSADTAIEMMNVGNQKENLYTIEGVAKSITCYENVIAVNLGSEVDFVNTNSWLIKRYTSSQEVRNIVIGDGLAGIIYRDKIEIVNL
ncbi:MAG: hypothetical protein IJ777_01815 [Clostridia bacterium]|nr:hypothetical protein [Clostridia bacterium]